LFCTVIVSQYFSYPFESGSISELVAKWLSTTGINPAQLIDTTDVEFDQSQSSVDSLQSMLDEAAAVEISRQEEAKLLSLSIEIGEEAKANTTAEAYILGKMRLNKIMSFYYSVN